jgi:hypothetical protein
MNKDRGAEESSRRSVLARVYKLILSWPEREADSQDDSQNRSESTQDEKMCS